MFNPMSKVFLKNKKNLISFLFSCRECLFYTFSVFCAFRVFGQERWFCDFQVPLDSHGELRDKPTQKFLYLVELVVFVRHCETVHRAEKKDYKQMFVHHVSTILLSSLTAHQLRIGVVIYLYTTSPNPCSKPRSSSILRIELGATLLFVPSTSPSLSAAHPVPMLCCYTIFFGPGCQRALLQDRNFLHGPAVPAHPDPRVQFLPHRQDRDQVDQEDQEVGRRARRL